MLPLDESPPDLYAILQVHPSAEPEIIEAAYRRLLRKYHPDALPSELRQDPDVLSRIRAINLAYDILSDPEQRHAYDRSITRGKEIAPLATDPEIETRVILVRCAHSHQTYRMLLGRNLQANTLFRVLGFEPTGEPPRRLHLLPSPEPAQNGMLRRFLERLAPRRRAVPDILNPPPKFPSEAEMRAIFDESAAISFTQIEWGGWRCPSCGSEYQKKDGGINTWCRCSACQRIYCAGALHSTLMGDMTRCPWCGRLARITITVRPGDAVDMPIHGQVERSGGKPHRLGGASTPQLPKKND